MFDTSTEEETPVLRKRFMSPRGVYRCGDISMDDYNPDLVEELDYPVVELVSNDRIPQGSILDQNLRKLHGIPSPTPFNTCATCYAEGKGYVEGYGGRMYCPKCV